MGDSLCRNSKRQQYRVLQFASTSTGHNSPQPFNVDTGAGKIWACLISHNILDAGIRTSYVVAKQWQMESPSAAYATPRATPRCSTADRITRIQPTRTVSENRNKTEHIVEQRRSFKLVAPTADLHTPAPSLDEKDLLTESVTKILTEIERLDLTFSLTGSRCAEITGVGLDTWDSLQLNYAESLNCKLEYLHPEKIIVVTYPSRTHESFNILLKPIADLVPTANRLIVETADLFIVGTNHDIKLSSQSSVTPDFGFGRLIKGSSAQYSILFDCAWSQPTPSVGAKIAKSLEDPAVLAVICFDIKPLQRFETPMEAPPATHNIVSAFPQDVLESRELLGGVAFCEHEWGQINSISMAIHHQDGRIETFAPLAPVNGKIDDDNLLEVQDNVDIALVKLLGKVMTGAVFEWAMHGETFGLDWDLFYRILDSLLVADAYDRYTKWMGKHGKANPAKRKLVVDEQVTQDWATRMVKRRSKKQKQNPDFGSV
ncbi:hypothetical protein K438DRAFT_1936146 [Mycena galopus ATCC 62051]|nr:hypothetical protein K438DRAFT_1936146 [Mycena galopus ATCC 62051]